MSLPDFINSPCTLHLRELTEDTDELGNDTYEPVQVATVWELQQVSAAENEEAVSDTVWVAFFLPGEDLEAVDAIVDENFGTFEIDGDPWSVTRFGMEHHTEVRVKRSSVQVEVGS